MSCTIINRVVQASLVLGMVLGVAATAQARGKPKMSPLPQSGLADRGATVGQVRAAKKFLVDKVSTHFGLSRRTVGRKLRITSAGIHNYGHQHPNVLVADGQMRMSRGPNRCTVHLTAMGDLTRRGAVDKRSFGLSSDTGISTSVKVGKRTINFYEPLRHLGGE